MGIRSILSKPLAYFTSCEYRKWNNHAQQFQNELLQSLISKAQHTKFASDHGFSNIKSYADFVKNVPVRDYEGLKPYIELIKQGQRDITWPGLPMYFAKTSGTTSGVKYIPISKESMPFHIKGAKDALLNYIHQSGKAKFLDSKLIFLSGSPVLEQKNGILTGRLSGIVNHHVPAYLRTNQLPDFSTNSIEDWETKLDAIVKLTLDQPMSLISGIPPWVQMYFDKITQLTGKSIGEVFPEFSLFVYGGVNFSPYRKKIFESIGRAIDTIETFPASEGFFAFQYSPLDEGLLLLVNHGIFYEFIPVEEYFKPHPTRLKLEDTELDKNYALVISTNAGLWAYSMGDTVKIVSKNPYKIIVTGRTKHFISAFGEHVIAEEVEKAMQEAIHLNPEVQISEFTVAPWVSSNKEQSCHEWWIAFERKPHNMQKFKTDLDAALVKINTYYADLIHGKILNKLSIKELPADGFVKYMKHIGKLGGQNKVPRLSNDRSMVDTIEIALLQDFS
jgi:hypothetical protein